MLNPHGGTQAHWPSGTAARAELPAALDLSMRFDHQDLAACAGDSAQLPAALGVALAERDRRAEPATALDVPQAFR